MTASIYRIGSDIYDASNNQKISSSDWNSGKYYGASELGNIKSGSVAIPTANDISKYDVTGKINGTLFGTLKQGQVNSNQPSNKLNSNTLATGLTSGSVASQLPSSNAQAQQVYNNNLLADSQNNATLLQQQANDLKATQLKEVSTQKQQAEADLSALQSKQTSEISNYDSAMQPIVDKARTQYNAMLGSLEQINYQDLVKKRLDLTNDVVNYSKMMNDELNNNQTNTLNSIYQGRNSNIKDTYTSRIATAQAAMSAIDGNFTLAFDIMDKGANAINQTTTNRINFLNSVKGIYDSKITNATTKVNDLSKTEKELIDKTITDLTAKQKTIQDNKDAILKLMQENPLVAHKAGLLLTDTPEAQAKKLNDFYNKNPQYTPDNQALIKKAMEKYFDAGISLDDSLETVKSKVMMSKIYEKETSGKFTLTTDQNGNQKVLNSTDGTFKDASSPNIGDQVGTVSGLPSYNTLQANPGKTRSDRNNNPGNIKVSASTKNYPGVIGVESNPALDGGNFLIFDSAQSGINAIGQLLMTSGYSNMTAEKAIKRYNGGGAYGAATVGLDPNKDFQSQIADPNVRSQVAAAIAKAEGFTGSASQTNANANEGAKSWAKLIAEGKAKINEVPDKMRQSVINEMANNGSVSKTDAKATQEIQDKISLIDDIIKGANNSGAIGPNALARTSFTSWMTGTRQALVGKIKQLTSQETLDKLINLKKSGGTLGALSDQERLMLQSSATKIGAWEMKDKNGVGTGFYNVSESDFIKELNNIKTITQKALESASDKSGLVNSLEQNLSANPAKIDEYNTLVKDNPSLSEDEINQLLGF